MAKHNHPETMEEVINSIRQACELAQNLESDLPNLANQPAMLSSSIDEIVKTLNGAKERLLLISLQDQTSSSSFTQMLAHETQQPQMDATPMQEWLRSNYAQIMDQFFQMQQLQAERSTTFLESKMIGRVDFQQLRSRGTLQSGEMGGRDMEGSERSKGSSVEVQAMEPSPSRPRRSRKADLGKRTMMVPAPPFGNTDMPQEDGFTWRKYGQKEILGSKHPRSYYRCTHQKLYECPAKKQVQRLDHNPSIFEVTYRGNHTCHMSSTAPSSVPAPPQQLLVDISQDMTQSTISPQLSTSSASASGQWLSSMNLSVQHGGGGGMAPVVADASTGSAAGPSTSRHGADFPVVDMADAMFNSGSSSGNSMESLFPPTEDKWEPSKEKS